MYFKRLELFGFKSFAEKTKLKFEPGVTAVVGPNGCGKSNIADAIKWVLGEQSAKELRGSRMEDVIFNGTSNKEAINMAEVSLVLSNRDKVLPIDYEEVVITRRLFRSGDSEYLLNKMPVRLKDINDLLAGTGIGTSSYSMIEQGRIGLILSSKPEERRYLLEEASGITKFKAKKKEALRKLDHTENNLLRITDIVSEVHRQIQSIERQARKAEKYKNHFDQLKEMELSYSSFHYKNHLKQYKALDFEKQDFKKREEDLMHFYNVLTLEVDNSKTKLNTINEELQKCQRDISQTGASIDKNEHSIAIDRERIEELKGLVNNLKGEIAVLTEKLGAKKKDKSQYEEKLNETRNDRTKKEVLLGQLEESVCAIVKEIEENVERIRFNKTRIMELEAVKTKFKNELIKLGAEVQNRNMRLRRLRVEKEKVTQEKGALDSKVAEMNEKYDSAYNDVNLKRGRLADTRNKLNDSELAIKNVRQVLADSRRALEVLKSKRDMIKKMLETNEGFDKAVKAILNKSKDPENDIDVKLLADIIKVEEGMEQAADSVLGDMTKAMIVRKRSDAGRLIGLLRAQNAGRANFIILDDIMIGSDRAKLPPGAKPIKEFIHIEDGYSGVLQSLFGDTFVVDRPEIADELFSSYRDCKFVTRAGYLRQGERVFGGSVAEVDTMVLGRKDRIDELDKKIVLEHMRIDAESAEEIRLETAMDELRTMMENEEAGLRESEITFANIEAERQTVAGSMTRIDEEIMVVDMEMGEENQILEDLKKRGEDLNVALNEKEGENTNVQGLILTSEEKVKDKGILKEKSLLRIADIRGEISSIQVSIESIENNLKLRQEECHEIERDIQGKAQTIGSSEERVESLCNEIIQHEATMRALRENESHLTKRRDDLREEKITVQSDYKEKEAALKEHEAEIETKRNLIRDLEIKINEINYKMTSLIDRIRQAYKEDLTALSVEIAEGCDWEEVKENIDKMREKLDRMGPVNLVAIEEHKELEERYAFLTKQRDDLVNAKESLHKAIVKINATTRKLFFETFQKVRVEFKNYFRMLFGGGQAEMYLLDDRDILDSGIEIIVRPPGKKLQNILLLSGGEKALTAISLLFAIFKVNPSPFCVLDEIDAPLDETNIDRFTRVLREFLKISQFIIITHNKKTIQMAEVLYGITMAEKGVSRIVAVKFADNKQKDTEREEVMV